MTEVSKLLEDTKDAQPDWLLVREFQNARAELENLFEKYRGLPEREDGLRAERAQFADFVKAESQRLAARLAAIDGEVAAHRQKMEAERAAVAAIRAGLEETKQKILAAIQAAGIGR
jgi:hypothetical protein